jgi:hypothetical protein
MDAMDFLDDQYGLCVVPPNSNRWAVTFLLVGLLALLLIKKTEKDLAQTRKDYMGYVDDVD